MFEQASNHRFITLIDLLIIVSCSNIIGLRCANMADINHLSPPPPPPPIPALRYLLTLICEFPPQFIHKGKKRLVIIKQLRITSKLKAQEVYSTLLHLIKTSFRVVTLTIRLVTSTLG